MAIYIILIVSILFTSSITKRSIRDPQRRENFILSVGILLLFLLCALKNTTVGGDIKGYKEMYILAGKLPWDNFRAFHHFEYGYVLLTKIFSKMGISFQWFMAFSYLIIYIPLYRFLKKYSSDVVLSLIIYICYQFFVFNLTGIRQAIAMGLCLLAFDYAFKPGIKNFLLFIMIVSLASQIHTSAAIFILLYFVIRIDTKAVVLFFYFMFCVFCIVFRNTIMNGIIDLFGKSVDIGTITLGGSFLFLVAVTALGLLKSKIKLCGKNERGIIQKNPTFETAYIPIMLTSVLFYILLSGSTMLRAVMYFTMSIMVILPDYIRKYHHKDQVILRTVIIIAMFMIFYFETLEPNQFDLIPYKFFWQ